MARKPTFTTPKAASHWRLQSPHRGATSPHHLEVTPTMHREIASARIKVTSAVRQYTEYSWANGQVLAEKDQTGVWTDHIYANGKKIATAYNNDQAIHVSGTASCDNCWAIGSWLHDDASNLFNIWIHLQIWRQALPAGSIKAVGAGSLYFTTLVLLRRIDPVATA